MGSDREGEGAEAVNPHPCYPGGTYLGCGWAWIYECQQWGEPPDDICSPSMAIMRRFWGHDFVLEAEQELWPHLCRQWPDEPWLFLERMRQRLGL